MAIEEGYRKARAIIRASKGKDATQQIEEFL